MAELHKKTPSPVRRTPRTPDVGSARQVWVAGCIQWLEIRMVPSSPQICIRRFVDQHCLSRSKPNHNLPPFGEAITDTIITQFPRHDWMHPFLAVLGLQGPPLIAPTRCFRNGEREKCLDKFRRSVESLEALDGGHQHG